MTCKDCALALLDFHFETLEPAARAEVAEHLLGCRACRATFDKLEARVPDQLAWPDEAPPPGLADRASAAASLQVMAGPEAPDARAAGLRTAERGVQRRRSPVRTFLRGSAAAGLAAVAVWAFTVHSRSVTLAAAIDGQETLAPGAITALRLSVFDVGGGAPIEGATLRVLLRGPDGKETLVHEGPSDRSGTIAAGTRLPELPEGAYTLTLVATKGPEITTVSKVVQLARRARVLLSTDKPSYQPGQTIHVRALARDTATGRPPAGQPLTFTVLDSKGNRVGRKLSTLDAYGVASFDFTLADELLLGAWKVTAEAGGAVSSADVTVARYSLPKFAVKITPDRPWYRPGDGVSARVESSYFFGKPTPGAKVTASAGVFVDRFREVARGSAIADAQGVAELQLALPAALPGIGLAGGAALVDLTVTVTDAAGQKVERHQLLTVSANELSLVAVPEGGALAHGLPGRLLVLVARPDGEPAAGVTVRLTGGLAQGPNGTTGEDGIAAIDVTPTGTRRDVELTAVAPDGSRVARTLELSVEALPAVLRTERTLYTGGETVRGELFAASPVRAAYLDVVRDGSTISTRSVSLEGGRGTFAVDLPAESAGTITLYAYTPGRTVKRARKTLFVGDPRGLTVEVTGDRESYQPGAEAKLLVKVRGEDGKPAAASVGLAVVDESVFALSSREPALLRAYLLLAEELSTPRYELDPARVVSGGASRDRAAALLLSHPRDEEVVRVGATSDEELARRRTELSSLQGKTSRWSFGLGLLLLGVVLEGALRFLLERLFRRFLEGRWWRSAALVLGGGAAFAAKVGYGAGLAEAAAIGLVPLVLLVAVEAVVFLFRGELAAAVTAAMLFLVVGVGTTTVLGDNLRRLFGASSHAIAGEDDRWDGRGKGPGQRRIMDFAGGANEGGAPPEAMLAPRAPVALGGDFERKKGEQQNGLTLALAKPQEVPAGKQAPAATPARIRSWFPETMFWSPAVITGADGTASVTLPVADSITSWRISATASDASGRLGSGGGALKVFQDFFVDVELPPALTVGDEVELPVALHSYLEEGQEVELTVEDAPWLTLLSPRVQRLSIGAGEVKGVPLRLRAIAFGKQRLTLHARGSRQNDAIRREVEVQPAGVRAEAVVSGRAAGTQVAVAKLPPGTIPGTERVLLRIEPGMLSSALSGLEGVLRMPGGCFEQTSSATYPNVLVLDYLRRSGQGKPELEARATEYIQQGYQRLLAFEVPGGGFEWFGRAPANQVLTAYGLLEFADMARVYDVDPAVLRRTQEWLISRQEPDGSFAPDESSLRDGLYRDTMSGRVGTTAYVTWALAGSGYRGPALDRALAFLSRRAGEVPDLYTRALIAGALLAAGREREANGLAEQLAAAAVRAGERAHFPAGGRTAVSSSGSSADVEATALAALVVGGTDGALAEASRQWLLSARDPHGAWGSTQATVLALRTLLQGPIGGGDAASDAVITVNVAGEAVARVTLTAATSDLVQTVDLSKLARPGQPLSVELVTEGTTRAQWSLVTLAWVPEPRRDEALSLSVDYDRATLAPDDTLTATARATWRREGPSGMVMLALGVPPGFEVDASSVGRLVAEGKVGKFTLTGRQLLLYLDRLTTGQEAKLPYKLRALYPVKAQAPSSLAYLYYQPEVRAESAPVSLAVRR